MIFRDVMKRSLLLQWRSLAGYIHIEHHDLKINPQRQKRSYDNPRFYRKEKTWINVPLGKKGRTKLEEGKFREYKERMLNPSPEPEIQPDTESLWYGIEGEEPKHYFADLPARSYFKVSTVQRPKEYFFVPSLLQPNPALTEKVDLAYLQQYGPTHLVQIALKLRIDGNNDLKVWNQIDTILEKKIQTLSTTEIIQLKWALNSLPKHGRPQTRQILTDLIREELKDMDVNQLIAAYCAFKHDNMVHQAKVAERIINDPLVLSQINNSPKLMAEFIRGYASQRSTVNRKVYYHREPNQKGRQQSEVINKLTNVVKMIVQMPLSDVVHVMRSLHIAKIEGIEHILLAINSRLLNEYSKLDYYQAFEVLFVSQKVDSGDATDPELALLLKPLILKSWEKFTELERLKIVFCYWNIREWDDMKELYKSIPIIPDASMLYYFAQIQMIDTSERFPDVVRALFKIEYVPLPYFYRLRQFQHFIEAEHPQWTTEALEEKFFQTEKYFTAMHLYEGITRQKEFLELGKFLSTIACGFTPLMISENTELVQYGIEEIYIAVEALLERDFLPSGEMKKEAMLKAKCMESLGWAYVGVRWKTFREQTRNQQLEWMKEVLKAASARQVKTFAEASKSQRDTVETVLDVRSEIGMHSDTLEEMINDDYSGIPDVDSDEEEVIDEDEERRVIEIKRLRRITTHKRQIQEALEEARLEAEMP